MKKALILFLITCLVFSLSADLIDIYKKGEIKLADDREFGKDTKWDELFYDTYKGMTIAPDGSIFVANQVQHNILKFDAIGNVVKKFGREGQGPGDLFYPGYLSILDGKFLSVGDFPQNRKFSLFDLQGNFQKVIRIKKPAFSLVSLRNNKVAYLTWINLNPRDDKHIKKKISIFIKDITGRDEINIASYVIRNPRIVIIGSLRLSLGAYFTGDVFIARAKGGNLLVGLSTYQKIDIYSPQGEKIKSFPLKIEPVKVTNNFFKEFKEEQFKIYSEEKYWPQIKNEFKKQISSKKSFFDEYLPYFRNLLVDSEGNILVFKERTSFKEEKIGFQVYSPDGEWLCDTSLNMGEYKLDFNQLRWFRKLHFTSKGIFALLELKASEDVSIRIIKVKTN